MGVTGLNVIRSTLENLLEHLGKDTKSTSKAHSLTHDNQKTTGHQTTMHNLSIVGSEGMALLEQSTNPYTLVSTILL